MGFSYFKNRRHSCKVHIQTLLQMLILQKQTFFIHSTRKKWFLDIIFINLQHHYMQTEYYEY